MRLTEFCLLEKEAEEVAGAAGGQLGDAIGGGEDGAGVNDDAGVAAFATVVLLKA